MWAPMTLDDFNNLADTEAEATLMTCCHCPAWAAQTAAGRPFTNLTTLLQAAAQAWEEVDEAGRLEAFAAHPLIGDVELLREKFAGQAHSEQGQVLEASDTTLNELARLNQAYLDKFGFIFIICATGKSADEMLEQLRARIANERAEEIGNASTEQAKITALRLNQTINVTARDTTS